MIFEEGDPVDGFYVIASGEVQIQKRLNTDGGDENKA